MRHAERAEDFALAEDVEGFVGETFESNAENDEANVAVFGARAGSGRERDVKGRLQKVFAGLGAQEKLFVGGQAGAMRQQHAQRDFAPRVVTIGELAGELRDDRGDGGFEIKQAALVENHRHGGRGHNLGERGEIEDACGGDFGRSRIIGETAEGLAWRRVLRREVTASEQAGKARAAMAFSRMPKALRKRSSCATRLRTRKEKPDSRFGSVRFKGVL